LLPKTTRGLDMREIPLSGLGGRYVTVVDDEDYEWLSQYKWNAIKGRKGALYAQRRCGNDEKLTARQMQRQIMDPDCVIPSRYKLVDHINHDPLDNRKSNLRWVSSSESIWNTRLYKNNKTGYRGVFWWSQTSSFTARLCLPDGKAITRSGFLKAEDAAREYNKLALLHRGSFAKLNVIPETDA